MPKLSLTLPILLLISSAAFADNDRQQVAPGPSGFDFIEDGERGWFWYEPIPEPVEEEEVTQTPAPPPEPTPAPEPEQEPEPQLALPAPPPPGPKPLSAEWFKESLEEYRLIAIDNPTPENVKAYLYLQRVMMDKAEKFAKAYTEAVMGDPILDETNRYPTSGFAGKHFERTASKSLDSMMQTLSDRAGLFFFFDDDCHICGQQAWILNEFRRRHDIDIIAVSMDGSRLDSNEFKTLDNDNQASLMQVKMTPAIVLASPPDVSTVVGQGGGYSLADLEKRVLLAAKRANIISPEEYDQTLPVRGGLLLTDANDNAITEEDLQDPIALVEKIQRNALKGYTYE